MNQEVKTINGYSVKDEKAIRTYDTVALMKADRKLKQGQHVKTRGYYSINDGGSAEYYITNTSSNSDYQENLENGIYATLILEKNIYNAKSFGLKTDGTDNTTLFNNMISYIPQGRTIYFPKGKYTFTSPLSISKRLNLIGEEISITDIDDNFGSVLSFVGLSANTTALTLPATKSLIKNLMLISDSYNLVDDRSLIGKGVDVFTETINVSGVNGIGFSGVSYGTTIKNCRFRGFSNRAINGNTFHIIENCSFWKCNEGIHVNSDNTVNNNRFFYVTRGIVTGGSNNIITNNRMDSVKEYGVYLNTGKSNIVNNLNVDYCQYNAVYIFNNENTIVDNIIARCGTIYPYDSDTDENINSFYPINDYTQHMGLVCLAGYSCKYNEIHTNAKARNPLDSNSTLKCSLIGVTTINHPTDNDIYCSNDSYYIGGDYYMSYFKKAVLIASGNFTGNIFYKGYSLRIKSDVSDFSSSNWNNMLISDLSTPIR